MRVTSKGQITIPQAVRDMLGIQPGMEVEFQLDERGARLVPATRGEGPDPARRMSGVGTVAMSTEEITALTRGHD